MKRILIIAALAFSSVAHTQAQKSAVFAPDGKAIKGYDPVAFFKASKTFKGLDNLSYQWQNATWLFSSKENLAAFKASPEKYAPQYGGYCAYGTADGHKAPTETDTWTVVNGKLYFNYNSDVKAMWVKDQKHFIEVADRKWPEIKDKN
jgi:YHS domain-containing protein